MWIPLSYAQNGKSSRWRWYYVQHIIFSLEVPKKEIRKALEYREFRCVVRRLQEAMSTAHLLPFGPGVHFLHLLAQVDDLVTQNGSLLKF
jgi:hypothetical protein